MKLSPRNPRSHSVVVALVLLALLALAAITVAEGAERAPAVSAQDERARKLAGERGCTACHRDANAKRDADEALPLAPGWDEIATRYRNSAGAEERLVRTVMGGADPSRRHWKDRLEFNRMEANPKLTLAEARSLVRWILSSAPSK